MIEKTGNTISITVKSVNSRKETAATESLRAGTIYKALLYISLWKTVTLAYGNSNFNKAIGRRGKNAHLIPISSFTSLNISTKIPAAWL